MSVAIADRQATFCATFIDELIVAGVRHAVICPGSRSTPLALAAAERLEVFVRLDERSAGFFAQGLARATSLPVLIIVTSGTAAAELAPAVAEARFDLVPLIVATADRPPELRGVGSPQTIIQRGIFGGHPRYETDPGLVHDLDEHEWRRLANRLVIEATGAVPGPVHVNLPFAEPLLGTPGALPPPTQRPRQAGFHPDLPVDAVEAGTGLIVAGGGIADPATFLDKAATLQWPVLADPRSGLRGHAQVVCAFDSILRADIGDSLRPDVVLLAGAPPASKVLGQALETWCSNGTQILVANPEGLRRHPTRLPAVVFEAEPTVVLAAIAEVHTPSSGALRTQWHAAEHGAEELIETMVGGALNEPGVARLIAQVAGTHCALVCSSSMPIRDLEWFGGDAGPAVVANRGANGIDGVISTAMGVAAAGLPTICLIGDLAFLHDVSALNDLPVGPATLSVVVVNNRGGGIFSFLPQHDVLEPGRFEQLFGTPPSAAPAMVARGFGCDVIEADTIDAVRQGLETSIGRPGMRVIVVEVPDREANRELHESLNAAIERRLSGDGNVHRD